MDLIALFEDYEKAAADAIEKAQTADALEEARITFLGKKKGRLKDLQLSMKDATPEERPVIGKKFNDVKNRVTEKLNERKAALEKPAEVASDFDVTLPGTLVEHGRLHPIVQTIVEFKDLMGRFGFSVVDGPEIEDEWHNFNALNIPLVHPARDPLDNFYLAAAEANSDAKGGPRLLRSQTSTVQIRTMEETPPPVRVVSLGRVYRPDTIDKTHSCMFHQMEGLMVGESVTMAELKTVLLMFAQAYLGDDVTIRFRPSFFPFTEPSVEVDMKWGDDWLEVGGAGMIDPNVLRAVNYDPEEVTGFAFGLGIERFCMKRHEIDDIRRFYENDIRFLSQF